MSNQQPTIEWNGAVAVWVLLAIVAVLSGIFMLAMRATDGTVTVITLAYFFGGLLALLISFYLVVKLIGSGPRR